MKPGEILYIGNGLGIYGVLPWAATIKMQNNKAFAYKFNIALNGLFVRTLPKKIKKANKMLAKEKLGEIRMLTKHEIKAIRKDQKKLPPGALLCRLENETEYEAKS